VKSCAGGVTCWLCQVVVTGGGDKVLSLSMFCYNMKLMPSIIAKLQPVTAKTMKRSRSLMSEGQGLSGYL
jgi:hypothetical protein